MLNFIKRILSKKEPEAREYYSLERYSKGQHYPVCAFSKSTSWITKDLDKAKEILEKEEIAILFKNHKPYAIKYGNQILNTDNSRFNVEQISPEDFDRYRFFGFIYGPIKPLPKALQQPSLNIEIIPLPESLQQQSLNLAGTKITKLPEGFNLAEEMKITELPEGLKKPDIFI